MVESTGIDYTIIDEKCIPSVKLFNSVGLKTLFSCQGHKPSDDFCIIFDDSVTDEDVREFLIKVDNVTGHIMGGFYRWERCHEGVILSNWQYKFNLGRVAKYYFVVEDSDFEIFCRAVNKSYGIKHEKHYFEL